MVPRQLHPQVGAAGHERCAVQRGRQRSSRQVMFVRRLGNTYDTNMNMDPNNGTLKPYTYIRDVLGDVSSHHVTFHAIGETYHTDPKCRQRA